MDSGTNVQLQRIALTFGYLLDSDFKWAAYGFKNAIQESGAAHAVVGNAPT